MLLKLKPEPSDSRKYNYQKLLTFSALLRFEGILLRCKCKLSFKFVLIPKIKVSALLQNRKLRKPHAINMHEKKKSFQRKHD